MYAWIGCRHYFLLSFVDAYSRYVVHYRLLLELTGRAVAIELEAALSKCKGAKPRIVHDHGSEFCNSERTMRGLAPLHLLSAASNSMATARPVSSRRSRWWTT